MSIETSQKILLTGSAGFIGMHTAQKLLALGHTVIGVDLLGAHYDPILKERRNELLKKNPNYIFYKSDISDFPALDEIVKREKPDSIVHLAALAGVRYSLVDPWAYESANSLGTLNVFEVARQNDILRVVFASSSSVYGANKKIPFSESDVTDSPVSMYAATKKTCELTAYTYHHLYKTEVAALRFFTVYGEWYRPDMALYIFAKKMLSGKPIDLFNHGKMRRDFTFVADVVEGLCGALFKTELGFEVYNLGNDKPIELEYAVELLEKGLDTKAVKNYMPIQQGDVEITYADTKKARAELGYNPQVTIEEGIPIFCDWFLENKEWLLR